MNDFERRFDARVMNDLETLDGCMDDRMNPVDERLEYRVGNRVNLRVRGRVWVRGRGRVFDRVQDRILDRAWEGINR